MFSSSLLSPSHHPYSYKPPPATHPVLPKTPPHQTESGTQYVSDHSSSSSTLPPPSVSPHTASLQVSILSMSSKEQLFFKISHKAQYYQLTLKISTKKEPLISQKSQTFRFYLYSISPNCTILA